MRFNSEVGEWREVPGLPSGNLISLHMLKLNEILYILLWDDHRYRLYALDAVKDAWIDTGVELPRVIVPQLATALGRLFFEGFNEDDGIVILEIDFASRRGRLVTTMDEMDDNKLLGVV